MRSVGDSAFVRGLQDEARIAQLPINVGIHEPAEGGKKVKNTLIWIDGSGDIVQRYQKIHLFDVDIKDGPSLKESKYEVKLTCRMADGVLIAPGALKRGCKSCRHSIHQLVVLVLLYVSMYVYLHKFCPPGDMHARGSDSDLQLRFPEISLSLKRQNSQIITYPSAFTVPTGRLHWEVLLRARAIETQSYIVAAAQAGAHNEKRTSYGHSLIVSPRGEVLASLDSSPEPDIAVADIDLSLVEQVRREMPLLRRTLVSKEFLCLSSTTNI